MNNATLDYLELWYFASWEDDQGQQSTTRLPDPALTLELLGENRIVKYASFDESVSLSIWGGVDITVTGGGSLTLPLGKGMNLDASILTLTQGSTVKLFGHVWNNGFLDVADGKFILGSGADYDSCEDGELRGELAHEDGATFLSYRYLQQDDEGFWYVNMEDGPYTEFGMLSASRNCGIFYLNTWKEAQGKWIVEPVIPKTDSACLRISSFTGDMPIREGEENTAYFTVLDAVGTLDGEDTSIYVQKDGKELARTPFHIGQRRVDFYSSPVASVETLINRGDVMPEFRTSPEQDNVFYLILRNSEEQTLVTLNDRFECYYDYGQIFEDEKPYTMEPQGNGIYKITVHEEFAQYVQYDWRNFNLIVEAQFEGEDFAWGADIWVSPENMYSEKARIGINGSDYLFYEETSQIWRDYGTGEYDEEGNELWVREKTQLPEGVHYDLTTNTLTLENATLSMLDLFYDAGYTDENGEFQMSYRLPNADLSIVLAGENIIEAEDESGLHIHEGVNTTFSGSGSLTICGQWDAEDENPILILVAMEDRTSLTVGGSAQVIVRNAVSGGYTDSWIHGICGNDGETGAKLTVTGNGSLTIQVPQGAFAGNDMDSSEGGFRGLENLNICVEENGALYADGLLIYKGRTFTQTGGSVTLEALGTVMPRGDETYLQFETIHACDGGKVSISGGDMTLKAGVAAEPYTEVHFNAISLNGANLNISGGNIRMLPGACDNFKGIYVVPGFDGEGNALENTASFTMTDGAVTAEDAAVSDSRILAVWMTAHAQLLGGSIQATTGTIILDGVVTVGNANGSGPVLTAKELILQNPQGYSNIYGGIINLCGLERDGEMLPAQASLFSGTMYGGKLNIQNGTLITEAYEPEGYEELFFVLDGGELGLVNHWPELLGIQNTHRMEMRSGAFTVDGVNTVQLSGRYCQTGGTLTVRNSVLESRTYEQDEKGVLEFTGGTVDLENSRFYLHNTVTWGEENGDAAPVAHGHNVQVEFRTGNPFKIYSGEIHLHGVQEQEQLPSTLKTVSGELLGGKLCLENATWINDNNFGISGGTLEVQNTWQNLPGVENHTYLPITDGTITVRTNGIAMVNEGTYHQMGGTVTLEDTVSASGAALLNTGALLLNSGVLNVSGWNALVAGYSADFGGEGERSRVQVGGGDQANGVLNITTNHIGILVNSMVEITGIAKVNVTLSQKDPTRGECAAIWVEKHTGNPDGTGENLSGLRLCAGANVNLVNKAEDGVGLYAAHSPVFISGFADGDGAYIYPTLSIEAEIPVSSVNASEQECNITLPDGWTFRDSKKALQFTAAEQADGSYCHTLKDPDGAVTVGTEKVTSVNTLEELMALLKYVQDEDMYYLNQTVILEGNVSLADIALTIGGNLTIRGKLSMAGRLVVSGGTLDNQGVFILEKGAVLELHGTYQGSAPVNNGGQIYPMAEILELHARKTTLDISRMAQLELTMDKNALPYVTWTSSNKKIVDPADIVCNEDGTYTVPFAGKTLGKVTLTATAIDGSGKSDSVQLTVTGGKLTARLAQPVTGLQPEEFAGLLFFLGDEQVDPTWFSVTSSNETVVRVTHPQWSVVGVKPGTARITAVLENDPLKRKVTLNVKGIAPQVESLKVQYEDENGNIGTDNFAHAMYTDAAATLTLTPLAVGSYLPADTQWSKRDFTWKSSDSKLVKLAVNNDGTATAMLQKGASGICTITVTSNDETKASATLTVTLKDYSPRLANTSVSLNPMSALGTQLELVETYGNKITAWSIAPSDKLEVKKSGDEYVLCAKKTDLKGTINATLSLEIENEETGKRETYEKNLKVSIRSSTPALTIKQTAKLDLFYSGSTAAFTVTAKNARVTNVTFVEEKNPSFVQVENGEDSSNLTIGFSQAFLNAPSKKPNTRITLLVEVEGYHPIEKTVTLATVTSKPALVSNPASSVLGGEARRVKLMLAEKASGESLDLTDAEITCMLGKQELVPVLEDGCLVLEDCTAGTLNISVRMNGWNQSVKLSHRVKIENKLPTLKLAASTLKLNSFAPDYAAITDVNLSQTNRSVTDMGAFTCSATDGIHVAFDPDTQTIAARLNPEAPAKNGTYTFTAEYYEVDGQRQDKKVTVKVNVAEIRPTAKLSSGTVKLNTRLAGEETGTVALTAKTVLGYDGRIDSVEVLTDWQEFDLDYADGRITVKLNTDKANVKRVYTLCPVVGDQKLAAVKLTLQSYDKAPSVSQSASGKLDLLLPDSAITYTISKISNALGTVSGVSLADANGRIHPDGEAPFAVECVALANGKQGVRLTLVPGKVYAPNSSIRFRLIYSICGEQVSSSVLTAKITQSSVKLSAPAVTWFQSQKSPLKLTLSLTSPAGTQIGKIELNRNKTAKELLAALGGGEVAQAVSGSTGVLTLALENPASLAAGKSYSLTLDVTPAGAQTATSIRVTVKIAK